MLKNYLNSAVKKFVKKDEVFDVVLYGSAVKGKEEPGDIDVVFIFWDKSLKERLEINQKFKDIVKDKIKKLDVKSINFQDLFDNNNLARQGILIEGYSLLRGINLSQRFGFYGYALFSYKLKNLNHNEKTKFTYALIGRNSEGMVKKVKGEQLGKGVIMVPIENSLFFQDFLDKWKVIYKKKNILVSLL